MKDIKMIWKSSLYTNLNRKSHSHFIYFKHTQLWRTQFIQSLTINMHDRLLNNENESLKTFTQIPHTTKYATINTERCYV